MRLTYYLFVFCFAICSCATRTEHLNDSEHLYEGNVIPVNEEYFNVLEYGVTSNNIEDDDAIAISALAKKVAENGGGVIYFPKGVYHLKSPIWGQSNVDFVGEDMISTILKNVSNDFASSFVFACGWYHERDIDFAKHYHIKDIKKGDSFVQLSNGDISHFNEGEIVIVRQGALPRSLDTAGQTSPFAQLNKISKVDIEKQKIYFEYAFEEDLGSNSPLRVLTVTKLEGASFGNHACYLTENIRIENFSVETTGGNWMSRDAVYKGRFKNIKVLNAYTLLGGNGKQFCQFENIFGNFSSRFIELAEGSSNNIIRNVHGVMYEDPKRTKLYPLIVLKPGDSLSNFSIENKTDLLPNMVLRGSGKISVSDGKIKTKLSGPIFILEGDRNMISNLNIEILDSKVRSIVKGDRFGNLVVNSYITNCVFIGDFNEEIFDKNLNAKNFYFNQNTLVFTVKKPKWSSMDMSGNLLERGIIWNNINIR